MTDDGGGVAQNLTDLLLRQGAATRLLAPGEEAVSLDGLIHLGALVPQNGTEPVKELFALARQAVLDGAKWIVGVTALGGSFGHLTNGRNEVPLGGVGWNNSPKANMDSWVSVSL